MSDPPNEDQSLTELFANRKSETVQQKLAGFNNFASLMAEKQNRAVSSQLIKYSVAMFAVPLIVLWVVRNSSLVPSLFGENAVDLDVAGAIGAIIAVNVVIASYVAMAMNEK